MQTIAEESTAWPQVTRPVYAGGLGFGFKWNMGWMHDALAYIRNDPIHRRFHHDEILFSLWYAFNENFVLPLSHDEVVYGKRSLLSKMPGARRQQFANLRLLLGFMWMHPGKKLLFMGGEFGQQREWSHDRELDWWLCAEAESAGVQRWVGDLNRTMRAHAAFHSLDVAAEGFRWVDNHDVEASVLCFLRVAKSGEQALVVCNFTPVVRHGYRVGVPHAGRWQELLNSDATDYGGSGVGNLGEAWDRRMRVAWARAIAGADAAAAGDRGFCPRRSRAKRSAGMKSAAPGHGERVVIENVVPSVDCGRFAIKRVVGETVVVRADVFADGHDVVVSVLGYRRESEREWSEIPMWHLGNDRWEASFVVDREGAWQYTVSGWIDPLRSWRRDLLKRTDPDDIALAAKSGAEIAARARRGARATKAKKACVQKWAKSLADAN